MRGIIALFRSVALVALAVLLVSGLARAEEVKMIGVVTKIDIAGKDAKTAVVTLKDTKTEKEIEIIVNDDLTLDKFKDHRIVEGDEIRCRYEVKDGKDVSTYFRKTAGC